MRNETRPGNRRAPRTPHLDALVQRLDGTVPGWRGVTAPAKDPDAAEAPSISAGLAALDVEWTEALAARERRAKHGERPHSAHYSDLAEIAARALRVIADLPPGVERNAEWAVWHARERAAVQTGDDVEWVERERGDLRAVPAARLNDWREAAIGLAVTTNLTLVDIAHRVGVSRAAIYKKVPNGESVAERIAVARDRQRDMNAPGARSAGRDRRTGEFDSSNDE